MPRTRKELVLELIRPPLTMNDIKNNLAYYRQLHNFSLDDVSKTIGVAKSTLWMWEDQNKECNRWRIFKPQMLSQISEMLSCPPEDINPLLVPGEHIKDRALTYPHAHEDHPHKKRGHKPAAYNAATSTTYQEASGLTSELDTANALAVANNTSAAASANLDPAAGLLNGMLPLDSATTELSDEHWDKSITADTTSLSTASTTSAAGDSDTPLSEAQALDTDTWHHEPAQSNLNINGEPITEVINRRGKVFRLVSPPTTNLESKNNMAFYRLLRGYSQKGLADACGFTFSEYNSWENTKLYKGAPLYQLTAIAYFLECPLRDICPPDKYSEEQAQAAQEKFRQKMDKKSRNQSSNLPQKVPQTAGSHVLRSMQQPSTTAGTALAHTSSHMPIQTVSATTSQVSHNLSLDALGSELACEVMVMPSLEQFMLHTLGLTYEEDRYLLVKIVGNSMYNPNLSGSLAPGAIVVLDTQNTNSTNLINKVVGLQTQHGFVYVKRLCAQNFAIVAQNDNPQATPQFMSIDPRTKIIGAVVAMMTLS